MGKNKNIIQSYYLTSAKYHFSTFEKRILTNIISNLQQLLAGEVLKGKIERDLFDDYCIELPTSIFLDENDKTNHSQIKKALDLLEEKKFYFEDEKEWRKCRLIESPRYLKRGVVQFRLAKELVDVFLNFNKGYSKYQLEISLKLKSVYSMRIYELISNQTHPITYKIDKLKEMFGVSSSYNRNYNFIERVINLAKSELDEKANWSFEYQLTKTGRKFTTITFNPVHNLKNEDAEVYESELIRQVNLTHLIENQLKNYLINICHFSVKEVKNNIPTLQRFSEIYKANTLNKLEEIWSRASEKMNPKAYLIGSLKCEIENI
jgi:plasmid replication initiation protein